MSIALTAAIFAWHPSISSPFSSPIPHSSNFNSVLYPDIPVALSTDHIIIQELPGAPITKCSIKKDTVSFVANNDEWRRMVEASRIFCMKHFENNLSKQDSSEYLKYAQSDHSILESNDDSHHFNNNNNNNNNNSNDSNILQKNTSNDTEIYYSRVAVVNSSLYAGEYGEGGGSSQQASMISHLWLDSQLTGLSSEDVYIQRLRTLLLDLKVQLLLVHDVMSSGRIEDTCSLLGVSILKLNAYHLETIALMIDATVVGDVLELTLDAIGSRDLIATHLECSPLYYNEESAWSRNTTNESNVQIIIELRLATTHVTTDHSKEAYRDAYQAPINTVSIIVASPTITTTADLKDRTLRCLHRLRTFFSGGKVMPGAGLPEVLMSLALSELTSTTDYDSEVIVLLKAMAAAMEEYVHTVCINNGFSWSQAYENTNNCMLHMKQMKQNCNKNHPSLSVMNWLRELSVEDILSLPVPITINDMDVGTSVNTNECTKHIKDTASNMVLDVIEVKLKSVSAALHAAATLLNTCAVVRGGDIT